MDRVITMTYPTNEAITQTYNIAAPRSVAQVRSATHNVAYASGLTYNPLGQLTQMRLGNNLLITNTYDLLSFRLKRLQAGSLLDLSYRYDAVGNVADHGTQDRQNHNHHEGDQHQDQGIFGQPLPLLLASADERSGSHDGCALCGSAAVAAECVGELRVVADAGDGQALTFRAGPAIDADMAALGDDKIED